MELYALIPPAPAKQDIEAVRELAAPMNRERNRNPIARFIGLIVESQPFQNPRAHGSLRRAVRSRRLFRPAKCSK